MATWASTTSLPPGCSEKGSETPAGVQVQGRSGHTGQDPSQPGLPRAVPPHLRHGDRTGPDHDPLALCDPQPGTHSPEEPIHRQGAEPVESLKDLARPELWDDEEHERFLVDLYFATPTRHGVRVIVVYTDKSSLFLWGWSDFHGSGASGVTFSCVAIRMEVVMSEIEGISADNVNVPARLTKMSALNGASSTSSLASEAVLGRSAAVEACLRLRASGG